MAKLNQGARNLAQEHEGIRLFGLMPSRVLLLCVSAHVRVLRLPAPEMFSLRRKDKGIYVADTYQFPARRKYARSRTFERPPFCAKFFIPNSGEQQ